MLIWRISMLTSATAWAQFIAILVGIISSVTLILGNVRNLRKPPSESPIPVEDPGAERYLMRFPGDPERNRQDLIAVLLICAVLSLTVIDALVVTSGSAGVDENALLYAIGIGSVISLLGVVSWFYGAQYQTCV